MSIPYLKQVRSARTKSQALQHYQEVLRDARHVKLALESLDYLSPQERTEELIKAATAVNFRRTILEIGAIGAGMSYEKVEALLKADPDYPESPWPNPPF